MAREMTPQERAAALLERMGLCGHSAASQFVGDIIEHDQQTRRAALLEAGQAVSKLFDQQASELPDYYAALLDAGNAIDRLAQEG